MNINAYPINVSQVCLRITAPPLGEESATDAAAATAAAPRPSVHFIAAVDVSDSMRNNNQLGNVVQSLKFLLDYMTPADAMSVIIFGSDAEVVLRQVRTTPEQKDMIRFRLDQLTPSGMTNISAALSYVPELVMAGYTQGLLVLTDGEVNMGVTVVADLTRMAVTLIDTHPSLSLTMVGYGVGHNSALCQGMATATSGTYNVVNSLENVATAFGDTLGGLTTCALQQVRMLLPAGVTQRSAFPIRGPDRELFVGDILEGNEAIVLLDTSATVDPLVLTVRCTSVATGIAISVPVVIHPDPTPEEVMAGIIASLRFRVVALLQGIQGPPTAFPALLAECTELRGILTPLGASSSLVPLLLGEVERCAAIAAAPAATMSRQQASIVSQRTAYLGMGRGVLSQDPDDTDPTAAPGAAPGAAPAIDRSFSNPVQRAMSDGMRAASSAVATVATVAATAVPDSPPLIIRSGRAPSNANY